MIKISQSARENSLSYCKNFYHNVLIRNWLLFHLKGGGGMWKLGKLRWVMPFFKWCYPNHTSPPPPPFHKKWTVPKSTRSLPCTAFLQVHSVSSPSHGLLKSTWLPWEHYRNKKIGINHYIPDLKVFWYSQLRLLFVLLYRVVVHFSSVDQTMRCDHSLERYWTVLYCGTVCFTIPCGSNFFICGSNHVVWPFCENLLNSTVLCYRLWYYHLRIKLFGKLWQNVAFTNVRLWMNKTCTPLGKKKRQITDFEFVWALR